jgi:hypothetical protein
MTPPVFANSSLPSRDTRMRPLRHLKDRLREHGALHLGFS